MIAALAVIAAVAAAYALWRLGHSNYGHLRDAMDWQESILVTHDPSPPIVTSCCPPDTRCEQYQKEARKLARYRAAYARAGGVARREPEGRTVTLAELAKSARVETT